MGDHAPQLVTGVPDFIHSFIQWGINCYSIAFDSNLK